uniref:Ovule protein n=1 Tax=Steinernema glaseri TaxID=37863 RepID=A0A1I7XXD3_9BILA
MITSTDKEHNIKWTKCKKVEVSKHRSGFASLLPKHWLIDRRTSAPLGSMDWSWNRGHGNLVSEDRQGR